MFNFGWGELVVIGIVALIAIGPKELPTVLRTLGQWMGKVRRMANEFQGQFHEALREAEFADLKKHADDISSSVSEIGQIDPIGDMQKDVERTFDETPPRRGRCRSDHRGRRNAGCSAGRAPGAAGRRGAAAGAAGCRHLRGHRRRPNRRPPRKPGAGHERAGRSGDRGQQGALARPSDRAALAPDQGAASPSA